MKRVFIPSFEPVENPSWSIVLSDGSRACAICWSFDLSDALYMAAMFKALNEFPLWYYYVIEGLFPWEIEL